MKKTTYRIAVGVKPYFKEMEGYSHTLYMADDYPIDLVVCKDGKQWKVSEPVSGTFTCAGRTRKDAVNNLLAKVIEMGIEKYNKYVEKAISLEAHILELEQKDVNNSAKRKQIIKLSKLFGFHVDMCPYMLMTDRIGIDVLRLDRKLHIPENISMYDFIADKYGKETANLVKLLI